MNILEHEANSIKSWKLLGTTEGFLLEWTDQISILIKADIQV